MSRMEVEWAKVREERLRRDREEKLKKFDTDSSSTEPLEAPAKVPTDASVMGSLFPTAAVSSSEEDGVGTRLPNEEIEEGEEELTQLQNVELSGDEDNGPKNICDSIEKELSVLSQSTHDDASDSDVEDKTGGAIDRQLISNKAKEWRTCRFKEDFKSPQPALREDCGEYSGVFSRESEASADPGSDSDDNFTVGDVLTIRGQQTRIAKEPIASKGDNFPLRETPTSAHVNGIGGSGRRHGSKRGTSIDSGSSGDRPGRKKQRMHYFDPMPNHHSPNTES